VLALIAVAQFMVVLDATIVNVALPTIKGDLGFSEQSLSWVLNAYTLIFGGFLLLGGRAADRLGRRRLFMAGIALFPGASLLCGLSQSEGCCSSPWTSRAGGAMVSPAALSIILTNFAEGPERNRALAVWGAIAGAGGAIGLLLGGVIVEALSWRWVFFVNVPIGAVVLALAPRIVPESRSERVSTGGYDVEGAVASTLGTITLVFTLIKADSWGWTSGRTLAGFAIAAALIFAFLQIERRHPDPLVPLRIFSNRSLAAADATFLLVAAALFGVFFFLTLYLQQVMGYSALKTGVAYLPLSLTSSGPLRWPHASSTASRQARAHVGLLIATAGFILLALVDGHGDYASHVLPAMIIVGTGLGMSFVPITIAATNGVASGDSGGSRRDCSTPPSRLAARWASRSSPRFRPAGRRSALDGGSALPVALTHGFKGAFMVAALLCAVGVVLAITLLPGRRREPETSRSRR
jgi:EmrB/QacA subfamily drug resistance transporter